jgi:hypothetical protein
MRHLRPFPALIALAMIGAACSSPGASSGENQSQAAGASQGGGASQGAGASQPGASTGGGGGGGGAGGVHGSAHYDITGDATKSGDLAFFDAAGASQFVNDGWVSYFNDTGSSVVLQISSSPSGPSVGYGDGTITIVGAQSSECTFNFSKNDASGLKGTIDCPNPMAFNSTSGAQVHVHLRVTIDAHA